MQASDALLFNELFIDFLKNYFFEQPDQKFTVSKLSADMPPFYQPEGLLSAGITYLRWQGIVTQVDVHGKNYYQVRSEAIEIRDQEEATKNLNKEIDDYIKIATRDTFQAQQWQIKNWAWVILLTIISTAFFSALFEWIFRK
jgi:hypothetical protein